jgi:hypothetical protein
LRPTTCSLNESLSRYVHRVDFRYLEEVEDAVGDLAAAYFFHQKTGVEPSGSPPILKAIAEAAKISPDG